MKQRDDKPRTVKEFFYMALGSVLIGALFLAIDLLNGMYSHHERTLLGAALSSGGPLGIGLTLIACPGVTIWACLGMIWAAIRDRRKLDSQDTRSDSVR